MIKTFFLLLQIGLAGVLFTLQGVEGAWAVPIAGDEAFKQRKDQSQAQKALTLYREAYQADPQDAQAAWRVAMGCYFIGLRLTSFRDEKVALYTEGRNTGKQSIALDPHCAPCYFWTAINMALLGQEKGAFKMVFSLAEIRKFLEESIKIDPTYASSGALRLLGIIDEKLPSILGGSRNSAKNYYEKAIHFSPDEPLNYLFLAQLLDQKFSDRPRAVLVAQQGLRIESISEARLESLEARTEIQGWLKNLGVH